MNYLHDLFDPNQYEEGSNQQYLLYGSISGFAALSSHFFMTYFNPPMLEQIEKIPISDLRKEKLPTFELFPEIDESAKIPEPVIPEVKPVAILAF